jgi:hypothetical protein
VLFIMISVIMALIPGAGDVPELFEAGTASADGVPD